MISSAVSWASWRTCMLDVPSYFCYENLQWSSLLKYWRQGRICWSVIGIETTGAFLAIAVEQMGESKGNCFQLYIVSVFLVKRSFSYCQSRDLPFFFSVGIWRWNIIFSCLSFVATYLNWKLCNRNTFIIVNLYLSVIFRTGCQYTCQVKISSWYKLTSFKYKVWFVLVKICISLTFQDTMLEYLRYNYLRLR